MTQNIFALGLFEFFRPGFNVNQSFPRPINRVDLLNLNGIELGSVITDPVVDLLGGILTICIVIVVQLGA